MCGIAGIYRFNGDTQGDLASLERAVSRLQRRGPDHQQTSSQGSAALGHARLSIIDTSAAAHQPFHSADGRYVLVFNGEIYNYAKLREGLESQGEQFVTNGDTEVLLRLLMRDWTEALDQLNGFFAFACYDLKENRLLMARDRMGIKPLVWFQDEQKVCFGSEMKALLEFDVPRELDQVSLYHYLQLNYQPAPHTMLKGVKRLEPGHCVEIKDGSVSVKQWYRVPEPGEQAYLSNYEEAQSELVSLLESAVHDRMVADVPLGSFLSGGTDSSVIASLAKRGTDDLRTFSIGYVDEPFFDETAYAREVARKIGARHTVFGLRKEDLFEHLHDVLDYLDEPFADSSALAVYILSKHTRKEVTVALSGDGADEMFSGYNKHSAEWMVRNGGLKSKAVKWGGPVWKALPKSRQSKLGNKARQFDRFAQGMKLTPDRRYWRWASFLDGQEADHFLNESPDAKEAAAREEKILRPLQGETDLNHVLYTDVQLVLPNDMLTKVDLMSMANSLEVRTPFLDHRLVEWAFRLPEAFKIDGNMRKRVLQDAFRELLPEALYDRPKKGFEVPLLPWFQGPLRHYIEEDLLSDQFISEQGIFKLSAIQKLRARLFSKDPGDAHATVWAIIVFQHWWKRYLA